MAKRGDISLEIIAPFIIISKGTMCSISGFISLSKPVVDKKNIDLHRKILNSISYRGPDNKDWFSDDRCGLFVSQHNVTCLSNNFQPVFSEDKKIVAILNGEVYNFKQLNEDLKKQGYRIRTECDTETLLRLYEKNDLSCFSKISGMFGTAIYDAHKNRLLLARDRFGEKPVYYTIVDGILHFCTEANYLVPFTQKKISKESVVQYFSFGFPLNHMIDGIRRLPPGAILIAENGDIKLSYFWKPTFSTVYSRTFSQSAEDGLSLLESITEEMIPRQVDYGMYISGGIDSSVIAGILSRPKPELELFTSGLVSSNLAKEALPVDKDYQYVEGSGNELFYTDILASCLQGKYHRVEFSVNDFIAHVGRMISHLPGGPVMSTSFPLFYFSARESVNYRVCFTGEGSDELHGGYATCQPELYDDNMAMSFVRLSDYFPQSELDLLLGAKGRTILNETCLSINEDVKSNLDAEGVPLDYKFNMIRFFMQRYIFAPHLLEKADGMTMSWGPTELRMPFLNAKYAQFAFNLPFQHCRRLNERKAIVYQYGSFLGLPKEIVKRSQKQRTSLPYYNLFFYDESFNKFLGTIFNSKSLIRELVHIDNPFEYIQGLKGQTNAHKRAWSLLILELWLREIFAN